jgi:hypothetical protein
MWRSLERRLRRLSQNLCWPPICLLQAGFIFRVGVFSHDLNGLFFNFSSVRVVAIIGDYEW